MDRTEIIGIVIVLAGMAALLFCIVRKRAQARKEEEEERRKKAEESERMNLEEQRKRDELMKKLEFRKDGPIPTPAVMEVPRERSMILSYNTVFLTDVSHPARVYRADLFRPAYVGRSRDNDICIREDSVSRRHMRIFRNGAFVYAENLNDINGTLLNGKRLTRPKEITTGSRLKLGRVELKVEID